MSGDQGRFRPEAYGDALADVYDLMYGDVDAGPMVDLLAGLCPPGGRVLELGVGTGRIAIPLAGRGVEVHGIDASERMLAKLTGRDPEGRVQVHCGDLCTYRAPGAFDLVYVVLNTLFMVPSQEEQIDALRNAAEHLAEGGRVVVEVYDPSTVHSWRTPTPQVRHLSASRVMVETLTADPVAQTLLALHTVVDDGPVRTVAEFSRYAWPPELDLMARVAGMRLQDRFAGPRREPFVAGSPQHVSVYRAGG